MGVQEVQAPRQDMCRATASERSCALGMLRGHFHLAQKKGYSGVGLYTRHEAQRR
jgi:exodeoxyribonuclease-3